jgi:hypothetical protein
LGQHRPGRKAVHALGTPGTVLEAVVLLLTTASGPARGMVLGRISAPGGMSREMERDGWRWAEGWEGAVSMARIGLEAWESGGRGGLAMWWSCWR